jgi:hypothetical protein
LPPIFPGFLDIDEYRRIAWSVIFGQECGLRAKMEEMRILMMNATTRVNRPINTPPTAMLVAVPDFVTPAMIT